MKKIGVSIFSIFFMLSQASAEEKMDMDETSITGARELPKVLYVVPWKDSEIKITAATPVKESGAVSMDVLDRDVFKREIDYYGLLNPVDNAPR